MSEAAEILRLIESVDPSDTAKLDEIDARVWCFLNGTEYEKWFYTHLGLQWMRNNFGFAHALLKMKEKSAYIGRSAYTRSRNSLKEIRPLWPTFRVEYELGGKEGWTCEFGNISSPKLPTEELAELHAIIQSIEHERAA